jgi:hypothetical protein
MKNIYLILIVVLLFGVGGGVAFFVIKKKKDSPKAPIIPVVDLIPENKAIGATTNKKPVTTAPVSKQPTTTNEAIQFDIVVSNIDTNNRRFDYSMHYQGIRYKGLFEDGVTGVVQVEKGFGSFLIAQAMQAQATQVTTKGGAQKMRGGDTKANKMSEALMKNDIVNLSILDLKGQAIKQVAVNLSTGEQKSLNITNSSNLRTL